ncbi:GNAT family N-acetyltransferase [Umezawaea beigongshangensis]|uniref:GNAT family N-acetyltransferase n=1 Tax=Umezawaea beigongshangensis TaxID=2780383 RepID=UPI0018F171BB|nr:GNAT family N-acetyltransferase [Umezawaea beigongshangensis]
MGDRDDEHAVVRRMQELTSDLWSPRSRWHVGDLAHGRFQHLGREADWPTRIWERAGRVVAWGWIELPGELVFQVRPDHDEVADEVLDWFAATATAGELEVTVLETEATEVRALRRAGFAERAGPFFRHVLRDLRDLPEPVLPPGYAVGPVPGPEPRAAVHRSAFAGSRVTSDSYRAVMGAPGYRPELDRVVLAPDGACVSYATCWLDERHRAGLIEPVGTDPRHRRLGLARAVCLDGMRALAAAGATRVGVGPRGDAAYPVPLRLYSSLGFRPGPRTRTHVRRTTADRSD